MQIISFRNLLCCLVTILQVGAICVKSGCSGSCAPGSNLLTYWADVAPWHPANVSSVKFGNIKYCPLNLDATTFQDVVYSQDNITWYYPFNAAVGNRFVPYVYDNCSGSATQTSYPHACLDFDSTYGLDSTYFVLYGNVETHAISFMCLNPSGFRSTQCELEIHTTFNSSKYRYAGDYVFNYYRSLVNATTLAFNKMHNASKYLDFFTLDPTTYDCNCSAGFVLSDYLKIYDPSLGWFTPLYNRTVSLSRGSVNLTASRWDPTNTVKAFSFSKRDVPAQEDISIFLDNRTLIVTFSLNVTHFLLLSKNDYSSYVQVNGLVFSQVLPNSLWITSGYLNVQVFQNSLLIKEDSIQITGETHCRLHDCIFCWDAINNWTCIPVTYKLFFVLVMILLISTIVCLLPQTIKFAFCLFYYLVWVPLCFCFNCSRKFNKIPAISKTMNAMKRMGGAMSKQMTPVDEDNDNVLSTTNAELGTINNTYVSTSSDNEDLIRYNKKLLITPTKVFNAVIMLVCLSSLPMSEASCDAGNVFPASLINCQGFQSGATTCTLQFSALVTIPYVGATVCLSLESDEESVAYMEITYLAAYQMVSLNNYYYTADRNLQAQSLFNCWQGGPCKKSNCADLTQADRTAYGRLNNKVVTTAPGAVRCDGQSPTFNDLCFFGTPGCLFSGYGLEPQGDVYDILDLVHMTQQPLINVKIYNTRDVLVDDENVTLTGVAGKFYAVSVTINGQFDGDLTIFGNRKLITGANSQWLGPASDPNVPTGSNVGDVEGNSPLSFDPSNLSPTNFIYDLAEIFLRLAPDLAVYSAPIGGVNNLYNNPNYWQLPALIGGNMWYMENGYLTTNNIGAGALVLSLTDDGSYGVTIYQDIICPKVSLNSVSGCFNCAQGSTANITIYSTCKAGLVIVSADQDYVDVWTVTIKAPLAQDQLTWTLINFGTSQAINNFNLVFIGTNSNVTLPIYFTAVQNPIIVIQNLTTNSSTSNVSDTVWDSFVDFFTDTIPGFFDDIFLGSASWWKYLIFAGFLLVCIIILVAIGIPLISTILGSCSAMKRATSRRLKSKYR